ncbi:MAG TPA: hypothetical protein VF188_10555 [Longimicrobiales bacterium]
MWRRLEADGCAWEVRSIANDAGAPEAVRQEILEFRSSDGNRPPRRLALEAGRLGEMDDHALRAAYRRALPIGGDHYGRPGKRMTDAREA